MPDDHEPDWVAAIRRRIEASMTSRQISTFDPSTSRELRMAAVLVLFVHTDDGPALVLTERARTLQNYPGLLVFPGGAAEVTDDGAVATALREAAEEAGIDNDQIHVLGSLQPLILTETGFSVIPVIAWSAQLKRSGDINPDEVAELILVPLHLLADASSPIRHEHSTAGVRARFSLNGATLGAMTAEIIDLLREQP